MEFAISIYKGGKRVYAKDCDFGSYSKQGLICPICKQEVYLRKGNIREPYFAHFHATSSREIEECELRVSTDGNSTETSSLIENRGQRLEIFQQHFLSLIYFENSRIIEDVKFNNWINSRKDQSNQIINDIIRKCIDYFLENRQLMEAKYIIHTTKIKNKQILLQQKISLEVMSYLCDNAKFNYNLRYLLFYSMYQIYQYEKHKLIRQNIKTQDIEKICQYTVRIIMCNSWILAFKNTKINGVNNKTQQNIIKINKNRISSTSSPLQISSQNIQNASQLYDLEQAKVNSKWIGSASIDMDINQINAIERHALENKLDLQLTFTAWEYGNVDKATGLPSRKKVFVSCKLITEVNPDDKTALRFSFMTSKNVNVKVTTETYLPAVVYSFGYDFSLTVEKYSDLLFAKNGKLMEYPHITKRDELASLVERMIKDNKVEFIKTYIDHKGKKRVLHTYDDTVLILLALKRRTQLDNISNESTTNIKKGTYNKIKNQIVMEAFIEAYERSLQCSVTLPNTTIDNYYRYAQFKLNKAKEKRQLTKEIVKPKPTTTNRINTGLLGNWSQPFFLQLELGQYLADKLGTEPIQCQVAMENQLLILYTLDKSYTRSEAIKAAHSKKSFSASLTQNRTKLLTIGTIELEVNNIYKWKATQPQYEHLAKLLNRSTVLPKDVIKQYIGLTLTNKELTIGTRILCTKELVGQKEIVISCLDSKYMINNQVKSDCVWLDQIRLDITKKMLQANVHQIKTNIDNYVINNSDSAIHKAVRDIKKVTQGIRSVIRQHQPGIDNSNCNRLALLISKYIFTELSLNKSQAVELVKSLKTNVNNYVKLRDKVITVKHGDLT
ncbi:hypothetical protein H6G36_17560 [Anabaena minutissima FACHB-250]|nr:hypothetical protein [Anabaena minutissima FACHB-250]